MALLKAKVSLQTRFWDSRSPKSGQNRYRQVWAANLNQTAPNLVLAANGAKSTPIGYFQGFHLHQKNQKNGQNQGSCRLLN